MINGKFFTGLPAHMVDKRPTLNRQETHFFWPDDTQNTSTVDSRTNRRTNTQTENRNAYNNTPRGDQSNSDAENKERFKKEFTRSSIQFYDNVEETSPVRRNRKKLTTPPQKLQNMQLPENMLAKRKENLSSKIQFFDYGADDLNNAPKADKNNKAELERNNKNSPKLQNKNLSFDPPDDGINFIENDVRNMKIAAPPRRRNTVRETRPGYERPLYSAQEPLYSDIHDDYIPPRGRPLPPPPIRGRYYESDPDYDEYIPRRSHHPRSTSSYAREPLDYIDGHPSPRNNYYDGSGGAVASRQLGRQVQFSYSSANEYSSNYGESPTPPPSQQRMQQRKLNILKVDNDIRNNEQRQMTMPPPPQPTNSPSSPSQHHLRSNICFSDTESAQPAAPGPTAPPPPSSTSSSTAAANKKNIRSSAVNRVSVGLPD